MSALLKKKMKLFDKVKKRGEWSPSFVNPGLVFKRSTTRSTWNLKRWFHRLV